MARVGRPRKYESVEDFDAMIEMYFATVEAEGRVPTMAGAALFLGFVDRHSLFDYKQEDKFSHSIKYLKAKIEQDRSERVVDKAQFTPGIIFDLKNNHGWKDKQELDHTSSDKSMTPVALNMTAQEAAEAYAASLEDEGEG